MALAFEPMFIFERETETGCKSSSRAARPTVAYHEPASDVESMGGIFLGSFSWGGSIFEKNATTGNW